MPERRPTQAAAAPVGDQLKPLSLVPPADNRERLPELPILPPSAILERSERSGRSSQDEQLAPPAYALAAKKPDWSDRTLKSRMRRSVVEWVNKAQTDAVRTSRMAAIPRIYMGIGEEACAIYIPDLADCDALEGFGVAVGSRVPPPQYENPAPSEFAVPPTEAAAEFGEVGFEDRGIGRAPPSPREAVSQCCGRFKRGESGDALEASFAQVIEGVARAGLAVDDQLEMFKRICDTLASGVPAAKASRMTAVRVLSRAFLPAVQHFQPRAGNFKAGDMQYAGRRYVAMNLQSAAAVTAWIASLRGCSFGFGTKPDTLILIVQIMQEARVIATRITRLPDDADRARAGRLLNDELTHIFSIHPEFLQIILDEVAAIQRGER